MLIKIARLLSYFLGDFLTLYRARSHLRQAGSQRIGHAEV